MKTVAVIGCGRIANGSHFPALEQIEGVRVKYACDLILEKAIHATQTYSNVEQAITDYKVALADPEVEAVFVLTPNYAHYTVTMDALRAGKHVFCEKPITVNYALSCEMAAEAEKQGKKLVLNLGYSHPVFFEEGNGISFDLPNATTIVVNGIDKQAVGEIAAQIRSKRPPEPYLGKGIKYTGEHIRRKAGKAGK